MSNYEITNYKDIRESLALILSAEVNEKKATVILESLDDAIGNNAEYLKADQKLILSITQALKEGDVCRDDLKNSIDPNTATVWWSVADFEHRAADIEAWKEKGPIYDRSKFPEMLHYMIRKHDASIGITWDTIDWLLDYCVLENQEENKNENN